MSSLLGAWGVPDFGAVLIRPRIIELLAQRGTSPVVLHGAAGCGKSIAAAHYACHKSKVIVWVDACGEFLSAERVAVAATRALETGNPCAPRACESDAAFEDLVDQLLVVARRCSGGAGICVVVDDQGPSPDGSTARSLGRLAQLMRACSSQLLVTTRSVSGWPAEVICRWEQLGERELALDSAEAESLLEEAGYAGLTGQADALRESCGGHPALFAVLASQAVSFGVDATVARTASLDAWLERLIVDQMSPPSRAALILASLIKAGDERDLAALGVQDVKLVLDEIGRVLPLVRCSTTPSGFSAFRTHDLVDSFILDKREVLGVRASDEALAVAVQILSSRREYVRASTLVLRYPHELDSAGWIESHGNEALSAGIYVQLRMLLDTVPVHRLVGSPSILLLWAGLCNETGEFEEALAKCNAARTIAEHEGDIDLASSAASLALRSLCRCHRLDEVEALSKELLSSPLVNSQPGLHAEALVCLARAQLVRGDSPAGAIEILDEASRVAEAIPAESHTRHTLTFLSAFARVMGEGDWMSAAQRLSAGISAPAQLISSAVMARGNLGLMLVQIGRLGRARQMLQRALQDAESYGLDVYTAAYLPMLGTLNVASGAVQEGIEMMERGITLSERLGEEAEAQPDRVFLATALLASGRPDESLAQAECAFERLSVADNMGFRRLAALEVAASLLALGDVAAARTWTESIASEGRPPNNYDRVRADMILAEADRRDGRLNAAVKRLAAHKEYIRSENPNWQIAMYCRAFPEMLGLLALAVGPASLPAHMLRMIMPEQAEVALVRTKSFVDDKTWRRLGAVLLGADELAHFIARDGLPLCHVRMFGGLEVNIGTRSVRERDWKKRKARLLFAMLMMRRGQDVAREQIFEHLWPEMDEPRAKSNLYVIWSAMKSVLVGEKAEKGAKCPYVESVGGVCRSVRENVRTDVDALEAACARAREAESTGATVEALKAYRLISDIYRGDLLPGDCYDDWFINLREHYRSEFIHAMLRATEILLDANDPHTALIFVRRAIQFDQFREDLYQAALRCQIAAGQRSSAIDTYMQCRDKLCDELGLDPSAEMRALYDEILAMEERPRHVDFDPLSD